MIDEVVYDIEVGRSDIRFVLVGPGNDELMGGPVPAGQTLGELWLEMLWPDDREAHAAFRAALIRGETATVTHRVIGLDAQVRWIELRGTPYQSSARRARAAAIARDVTYEHELRQTAEAEHARAERLARTDTLTGAANRRAFEGHLTAEAARAEREAVPFGLFFIDIDHFKSINDFHGHGVGDEVIKIVVRQLEQTVRPYDRVARWGGDEFAVLIAGVDGDEGLRAVGEQLRASITGTTFTAELARSDTITVSIGGVRSSAGPISISRMLQAADMAMYAAKRRGRDCVCLFCDLDAADLVPQRAEATQIAEALALSVAQREGMPDSHSHEVADLAAALAEDLGLAPLVVERCRRAGLMHDVGKVGVPDAILAKAGPLDEAEWCVMREHPSASATLVSQIPELADCAEAVRHHHERWDGTGYPDGLAGQQIPIEARILAVADAYSAITSDRVYRSARSAAEALSTLQQESGRHLCPETVAVFLRRSTTPQLAR